MTKLGSTTAGRFWLAAALIVLLSLALNFLGIGFGVPGMISWTSNSIRVDTVIENGTYIWEWYGPAVYRVSIAACRVSDLIAGRPDPTGWRWLIAQRTLHVLLCSACVLILIVLTRLTTNRSIALKAGIIGACSPVLVFWSKTESANPQVLFWAMLFLLCGTLALQRRMLRWWLFAGLFAGATVATKEAFWGVGLALPAVALFYEIRIGQGVQWRSWIGRSLLFGLVAVALYAAITALDPELFATRVHNYTLKTELIAPQVGLPMVVLGLLWHLVWALIQVTFGASQGLFVFLLVMPLLIVGLVRARGRFGERSYGPLLIALLTIWLLEASITYRELHAQDSLFLSLAYTPLVAIGIERFSNTRLLPRGVRKMGVAALWIIIVAFGLLIDLNMIYNPRYDLLELGQDDPQPRKVYYHQLRDVDFPALPEHWTEVKDLRSADLLVTYQREELLEPRALFFDWEITHQIDTYLPLRLPEPNYNIAYWIMEPKNRGVQGDIAVPPVDGQSGNRPADGALR
ncbi:MAG: glycosyltransferase family 39 protein [Candidatus Alcyoniella australis]|nr:glycosyltransferase family 39 protein [Candidatus Alcyoniella australis]